MRVRVHFRFNAATGEVEEFLVDDLGTEAAQGIDHDARHEEIAAELGSVIERRPGVEEVVPGVVGATTRDRIHSTPVIWESVDESRGDEETRERGSG